MKTVLILANNKNPRIKRYVGRGYYKQAYEYLYQLSSSRGLRMVSGGISWYNEKRKIFRYALGYTPRKGWHQLKNIRPDVIYDKTYFTPLAYTVLTHLATYLPVVNDPELTQIIDNKSFTNLLFPEQSKKYYRVTSLRDLQQAARRMSGRRIVLKPAMGCGGVGIQIIDKRRLNTARMTTPLLAQEFVDTSGGITGITPGTHDLRLVFINNTLIYSYVRVPVAGSFLANIMQGGSMNIIPRRRLPAAVWPIVEHFQKSFQQYNPKVYTIDLLFDREQRPWVVETNSKPGVYFYDSQHKERDRFYTALIQMLIDSIDRHEKN